MPSLNKILMGSVGLKSTGYEHFTLCGGHHVDGHETLDTSVRGMKLGAFDYLPFDTLSESTNSM